LKPKQTRNREGATGGEWGVMFVMFVYIHIPLEHPILRTAGACELPRKRTTIQRVFIIVVLYPHVNHWFRVLLRKVRSYIMISS